MDVTRPAIRAVAAGVLTLALAAVGAPRAVAQPAGTRSAAAEPSVEGEPFTCWWRADKTAVHVGERFAVVLTCTALEFGRITAVPDLAPVEPTAVKLTPFEVVSGTAPPDIRERPRRYIQRVFTARLLGEGFFGRDIDVPSIAVPYAVHAEGPGGSTQGRTQAYVLPPIPMRILSLAPPKASDIQDASEETFAGAAARERRATNELLAGTILLAFAGVLLVVVGVRSLRGRLERRAAVSTAPELVPRQILSGCVRGLERLKTEAEAGGWTSERASQALAYLRVAAAVALGRPVTETVERDSDVAVREGQAEMRAGLLRRRRVVVSAPTTPATVARVGAGLTRADSRTMAALDVLTGALKVFDAARYGRTQALEGPSLDAMLADSVTAIRQVRPRRPARLARSTWARGLGNGARS